MEAYNTHTHTHGTYTPCCTWNFKPRLEWINGRTYTHGWPTSCKIYSQLKPRRHKSFPGPKILKRKSAYAFSFTYILFVCLLHSILYVFYFLMCLTVIYWPMMVIGVCCLRGQTIPRHRRLHAAWVTWVMVYSYQFDLFFLHMFVFFLPSSPPPPAPPSLIFLLLPSVGWRKHTRQAWNMCCPQMYYIQIF